MEKLWFVRHKFEKFKKNLFDLKWNLFVRNEILFGFVQILDKISKFSLYENSTEKNLLHQKKINNNIQLNIYSKRITKNIYMHTIRLLI